nr:glycosyltransferase family 4 protein [Acidobacteriota bacterium]
LPDLARQLRRHGRRGWDAVLADSVETVPLARRMASLVDAPLCVRVRGNAWDEIAQTGRRGAAMRMPGIGPLLRAYASAIAAAAAVVPVCGSLARDVIAHVPAAASRIAVIPISVDPARFGGDAAAPRARLGVPADARVVLTVTNFRFPEKVAGLSRRLGPMRSLLERTPSMSWVIAGGGPALEAFRAEAQQVLGPASSQLRLTGHVPDIALWYAAADVVMHLTALDALPRAVLEAQASARAVVADRVGGVDEMIEHGRTGYLLDPRSDPTAAIEALLGDDAMRARLGQAARASIIEHFAPGPVGARWATLFQGMTT